MNMKLFRVYFGSFDEFDVTDKNINKTLILKALCEKKSNACLNFIFLSALLGYFQLRQFRSRVAIK